MADGPSHFVIIETIETEDIPVTELRRLGPMHLGRAYKVKHSLENTEVNVLRQVVRIIDNDNFDPATGQEKPNADIDETDRGDAGDRGAGAGAGESDSAGSEGQPG